MNTVKMKEFLKEKKDILGICNDSESLRRRRGKVVFLKKYFFFFAFSVMRTFCQNILALPLSTQALFRVGVTDLQVELP